MTAKIAVGHDDEHDAGDHRGGRGRPTAAELRPHCMPRRQPAIATSTPKTVPLKSPDEVGHGEGRDGLVEVLGRRQVEHGGADDRAAEDAEQIGVEGEQRHHQDEREHARQHEELDRRDADGGQRVDLLVHLHRAELRGEGGAGAAGHDDGRHHGAHLRAMAMPTRSAT